MMRTRFVFLPLVTLALTIGCGGDSSGPPAVATVDVSIASDLVVGQTTQLIATPRDASGNSLTGRTVAWSTSNASIATVSNSGVVAGVAAGQVTITATIDGKSGTRPINVVPPPVATVTVTAAQTSVQIGSTSQATAVTRDASNNVVTGRTVTWASSDPAIASVSNAGLVTGLTAGTVTITALSEGITGSVQMTVTAGNPADAPQIASITPALLVEGQAATITGTKFGATAGANIVRIGGVAANVTGASATSLQIVVPTLNCKPAQNIGIEVSVGGLPSAPRTHPFRPASTFTLAQGQQRLIPNASDFCLQFEATSATETCLVGVQSVSEAVASLTPVNVASEGASAFVSSIPPSIASAPVFSAPLVDPTLARNDRLARHRAVSAQFIAQDRELVASRFSSLRASMTARKSVRNALAARIPSVGPGAKVGDVINMKVPTRPNTCQTSTPITVTVKAVGKRAILVEDNANPTGGFTASDYQTLSDRFDTQIYPTDISYFGEPTDFDENSRIVIVITKEVNKVNNLLGQVIFADLFDQSDCPASNEGEFFYGKAPDPTGAVNGTYTIANALLDAPVIIAHEFAHVIQIGRRGTFEGATSFQSTWELEGQATFAEEINGWTVTGLAPGQNHGFAIAWNSPSITPINWFQDAFFDLVFYFGAASASAKVPNAPEQCSWLGQATQGNTGPCIGGRDVYGVPYFFLRYLSDQLGPTFPGGEKAFHKQLIENEFVGYTTITDVTGIGIDVLLARWAAALFVDDRVVGIDPKLTFTTWNLTSVEAGLVPSTHLTPRERAFGTFSDQVSVRGGSTAYFLVTGQGRSATGLRVRDLSDGPLAPNMRLWVVRVR
jgi:uncharacterized protein YjdB